MPRFLAAVCLLLIGLLPCSVVALGLGEIDLKSALNQPFRADIPVTSESANDLSGLAVELASSSTFSQFGLDRAGFLANFRFEVIGQRSGAVIRITSPDPVVEPFVTLLLEITWAQGRLLREYTVLLDPPVFASAVAEPAVEAPVAGPAPNQTRIVRSPDPAPAPAATPTRPSDASPPAAAAPGKSVAGGNYGPVQRNDTLWGIAGRYTDGTSVNRNQMMLAIYRANPEAFVGNINRLKAGMILRVPDTEEVERLGRSEANAEAKRHNAEWKSGLDESPRLRLVPPPEAGEVAESAPRTATDAGSGVPAAGTAELRGRIDELEAELSDSRRLIELRDRELQALQEQLGSREGMPETPAIEEMPVDAEAGAEPVVPDEGIADEAIDAGIEEPVEAAVGEGVVQPEPQTPGPDVVITTSPVEESSFIARLFSSVWLYVSLVIVLLLGWLIVRRRTAVEGPADSWDKLDTSTDDFAVATTSLGTPAHEDQTFVVEETPPVDETVVIDDSSYADIEPYAESDFAADEEEPELPFERTISADSAVNLDQADPIAEADFHMAYGLYDQAADLLTNALESDPERKDLRLKLLEVYFIWENQGGFLKEAQILHGSVDEAADPDWNKVLIMGKQICPAEELFAAAPSAPGEADDMDLAFGEEAELGEDAEIDITFGAAEESVDLLFEDDDDGMIDFDLTGEELTGVSDSPIEETPMTETETAGGSTLETPTSESPMMDEVPDASSGETTMETPTMENPSVSSTMETPTIESPAVSTTLETPTIEAAAGDWATDEADSESGEPIEQTAEIDLDDLGLDLAGIDDGGEEDSDAEQSASQADLEVPDFGLEASPLDETGLKPQISGEEAGVGPDSIGESDVEDEAVEDFLDVEPTAQMQNVDPEALSSDTVEQPTVGDTAEQPAAETDTVSFDKEVFAEDSASAVRVDLDIGEDIALEDEPTGALDTSVGAVVEGATMTEVGTKLDLARAYIDMGDPDGARSILNEVLEEAVDSQRQEAQKLLDDLGD